MQFVFNLSEFFKKMKLHEPLRMITYVNNTNIKFAQKNCRKMFLEAIFFAFVKAFFSEFPYKIFVIALHDIIGLQNFSLSFCQLLSRITMCNLHWCCTFCTVLHLNCTALTQSESSIFFMCNITDRIGLHSVLLPLLIAGKGTFDIRKGT